jgi:6-pyruvoyl-tetrahydropterin synthase
MLKEEILKVVNQKRIILTDSQFRRYVEFGFLPAKKTSDGKGTGVISNYPSNSIEIITEIVQLKEAGYQIKEMSPLLFTKGFLVDFDKLKTELIQYVQRMIHDLEFLIEVTDDKDNKEFIIETMADENVNKYKPGRPSKVDKANSKKKKKQEQEKIYSVLNVINEIFKSGKLSSGTSLSFLNLLGYSPIGHEVTITKEWMDTNNWTNLIKEISLEDFIEVQETFNLMNMYREFLEEGKDINSEFFKLYVTPMIKMYKNTGLKNFLFDKSLVKLLITLLLVNPPFRKVLNSLLSFNGIITDYQSLKQTLPLLLSTLDQQLKGGEKEDE